jgi:hypothetical protein
MHQPVEIELKFLRLNSGEDIVTELQMIDEKTYRIINPLKIMYYYNENVGVMSMSLVPWIFNRITAGEHFDMEKHNVVVSSNLSMTMTKSYYGILNKIKNNMYVQETDDDEEEDEDYDEETIEETKEMLNEVIKKRYH